MCLIMLEDLPETGTKLKISDTNIFARHSRPGYQVLVYSMSIVAGSRAAMILPLPVVPGSGEDALRFIDLSACAGFFSKLSDVCLCERQRLRSFDLDELEFGLGEELAAAPILTVHEVGDYEASYVPSMVDFERLDARFRIPPRVWDKMPDYSDYGFAVFQLKITLSEDDEQDVENTVHPMAFEFPTRAGGRLFFPTVHVHNGDYYEHAHFSHALYCQRENARAEFKYQRDLLDDVTPVPPLPAGQRGFAGYDWYYRSTDSAGKVLRGFGIESCGALIDPAQKLHAMHVTGIFRNHDVWLGQAL